MGKLFSSCTCIFVTQANNFWQNCIIITVEMEMVEDLQYVAQNCFMVITGNQIVCDVTDRCWSVVCASTAAGACGTHPERRRPGAGHEEWHCANSPGGGAGLCL